MLSRIAENLYWMGRYVERADDTARLLDVHVHRMLGGAPDVDLASALVSAMGLEVPGDATDVDLWAATEQLAYDTDRPSSVAGSLRLARANARGLREALPTDVWEAVNRTHHDLDAQIRAARAISPHLFFRWVRDRTALIGGLIDSVSLHDDGWRFLTVGRNLERVDMTARLLDAVADNDDTSRWTSVLVSCGAYDAYLRTYGGDVTRTRALMLLLQAEALPRSVNFALAQAELCLDQIAASGGPQPDAAVRAIGQVRAELTYSLPDELSGNTVVLLGRLQDACRRANDLLGARYFRRADLIEWIPEQAI